MERIRKYENKKKRKQGVKKKPTCNKDEERRWQKEVKKEEKIRKYENKKIKYEEWKKNM